MGIVVQTICDRIAANGALIIQHNGKSELRKSFPRKLQNWKVPDTHFLILHDQDSSDCRALKEDLLALVPVERRAVCKVRIVCRALEAWYLGDWNALVSAGLLSEREAARHKAKATFRDPDAIADVKEAFYRLHREVGAISLARRIAPHLSLEDNRSASFRAFLDTLRA